MKKVLRITVIAVMLMALAMSVVACGEKSIYDELGEQGYTVRVRFDAGGAIVNGTQSVTIVEVYNQNDKVTSSNGKTGIAVLDPQDPVRGEDGMFKLSKSDEKNYYFSPGWYLSREVRKDSEGNILDAYGVPVSVSGREQGYIYSNRWDFSKDVLVPEEVENGEITFYSAWIPFFTYEIYAQNSENGQFELVSTSQRIDFSLPVWNERSGSLTMNDMVRLNGKTFEAVYFDEALTVPVTENIDGDHAFVDVEKGIGTTTVIKLYTTWREGNWIKIFDAEQFVDEILADYNADVSFILGADLDFTDVAIPESFSEATFNGVIDGDGFAIQNVKDANGNAIESFESIFGSIGEDAVIENITVQSTVDDAN